MRWKEFLKSDWRKIVIFVIITFITLFSIGIPYWVYPMCKPGGTCPLTFGLTSLDKILSTNIHLFNGFRIDWMVLVIELLVLYLLSCLIIWIYDKVRK